MVAPSGTLPTIGLIGHSNGHGLAGWVEMVLNAPHLQPYQIFTPGEILWKNIFIFTNAHGWPGPTGTPPTFTESDGEWLEMTTNLPSSPAAAHPHPSPYQYPNNTGIPVPNFMMEDTTGDHGTGAFAGVEVPLLPKLSNYFQLPVGMVKVCAPGSLFLRFDAGISPSILFDPSNLGSPLGHPDGWVDPEFGYFNWYTPQERFDWTPSTDRLYASWLRKSIAAKAAAPGMTMDHVIVWFGDNDSNRGRDRLDEFKDSAIKFIKRLREDMVANELTTLPAHQIRIIWMGVLDHYDGIVYGTPQGNPDYLNAILQEIADDDPYVRFVDTNSYSVWPNDDGHIDSIGYLRAAEDIFDAILEMDVDPYDALDTDDLLTVQQAMDRIRLYYHRGKVQTDLEDEVLLLHLNGSMHHIVHQCDDMAWWLRRRTPLNLVGGGVRAPIVMPKQVSRVLDIESTEDATFKLQYEVLGYTNGGRVELVLNNASRGTYTVHYIRLPKDLTRLTEKIPIPAMLTEWLLVETCYRLAGAAAQPLQIAHFQAKAQQQMMDVLKNLGASRRATRDRIYTQRRLPNVLNNRRGRRWDNH